MKMKREKSSMMKNESEIERRRAHQPTQNKKGGIASCFEFAEGSQQPKHENA